MENLKQLLNTALTMAIEDCRAADVEEIQVCIKGFEKMSTENEMLKRKAAGLGRDNTALCYGINSLSRQYTLMSESINAGCDIEFFKSMLGKIVRPDHQGYKKDHAVMVIADAIEATRTEHHKGGAKWLCRVVDLEEYAENLGDLKVSSCSDPFGYKCRIEDLEGKLELASACLNRIKNWKDQTSEQRIDHGSNGERDHYRVIASNTLGVITNGNS